MGASRSRTSAAACAQGFHVLIAMDHNYCCSTDRVLSLLFVSVAAASKEHRR